MNDIKQKKYDKAYLRMAQEWGKLSYCKRKQVGAIIVKERMIISDGYNGTPSGFENICEDEIGLYQMVRSSRRSQCYQQSSLFHPILRRCNAIHHLIALS